MDLSIRFEEQELQKPAPQTEWTCVQHRSKHTGHSLCNSVSDSSRTPPDVVSVGDAGNEEDVDEEEESNAMLFDLLSDPMMY
jgi:hypothetical protein